MNSLGLHHEGVKILEHEHVTWVDVQNPSKEVLSELEQKYQLHPIHLLESTQKIQHNEVDSEKEYLFFVMHYPVASGQADELIFGQVGIFLGKNFLITIRNAASASIVNLYEEYQHADHARQYFKHGAGYILYVLIGRLLNEISMMTDVVNTELDEVEDLVFGNSKSDALRIGELRQKIVKLTRIIGPKRLLLEDLADQINSFTHKDLAKYYANNTKAANRLWEVIQEAKETVEIYKDADFTTSTEQTNQILAVLTILFTLTIPITVIASVYGMNVNLPGGIMLVPWKFLGTYTTLIVLVALSLLLAFSMFLYLRVKKWF
ncbi:MAG: magnesium transporter CorA family protein [Candidatus Saccharimonadales bacterium]|jgi:magnesium transporter